MYMKAKDAISGKEGSLLATINGSVYEVAECKNIKAEIQKKKAEFRALGYRGTQHKATGWSGTGSMEIYYASSRWAKMVIDYCKTGKDVYFSLLLTNEDPTSEIGVQRVKLMDCNLDSAEIAKLDVDSDFLTSSSNFTFSDVELIDQFNELK